MTGKKASIVSLVVCFVAVIFLHTLAFAEVAIRVSGAPDKLSFPLPEGTNVVLTATIEGGNVKAVWLAWRRDVQARFMFVPVGKGAYQANLADEVLSAMIGAAKDERQFRIFAETDNGHIVSSIPIRYVVVRPACVPPRIYVYVDGKKKEIFNQHLLNDLAVLALISDSSPWMLPAVPPVGGFGTGKTTDTYYLSPAKVTRVEVKFDEAAHKPLAEVRVGEKSWGFRSQRGRKILALTINDEIRKAWEKHGSLNLMCGQAGEEEINLVLTAPLKRLDLPKKGVEMTITQRHSKVVPGSAGYVKVHIGDITGGQTLVSVTTADGRRLIEQTPMRRWQEAKFVVGEQQYRLKVEKLRNFLVGNDYGVFTISRMTAPELAEKTEREKIERLIDVIEKSDVILIRDGKEYKSTEAAAHIRKKYEHAHDEIHTLKEFIDNVASYSWTSRRDYLVRLPDGTEVKAKTWLREQSANLPENQEDKQ